MELLDPQEPMRFTPDQRPPVPEPPPVRILAVEDVVLLGSSGVERALDEFYVGLLRFERVDIEPPPRRQVEPILGGAAPVVKPTRIPRPLPQLAAGAMQGPVYRAENGRISIQVLEPPIERSTLRALGIEVPSLISFVLELDQREMEYTRQRGVRPGFDAVLLQDPAGNWLEVSESRPVG